MKAKKSLGQNFLMHAATARRIVGASDVTARDVVLEIGPGKGMLTKELLAVAKKVIAVEADATLVEFLKETFAKEIKTGKLALRHTDIRTFDTAALPKRYALVANIPYYITGEIIRQFLSAKQKPFSMTLLVQKEVAERIARSKKESILSLSVKAYGEPSIEFGVPRGSFVPAPNVDSAVLSVRNIVSPFKTGKEEGTFFKVVKAGFAHKRKRLASNLLLVAKKPAIEGAFTALKLPPNVRAEDVPLSAWQNLARALS